MRENKGLYVWFENAGLVGRILTAGVVSALALGILVGGDIASKRAVEKVNTTLETTIENIVSGSHVENSVIGTGKQDSTKAVLRDWKAQLEKENQN